MQDTQTRASQDMALGVSESRVAGGATGLAGVATSLVAGRFQVSAALFRSELRSYHLADRSHAARKQLKPRRRTHAHGAIRRRFEARRPGPTPRSPETSPETVRQLETSVMHAQRSTTTSLRAQSTQGGILKSIQRVCLLFRLFSWTVQLSHGKHVMRRTLAHGVHVILQG